MDDWFVANAVNQAVWHFGQSLEVALLEAEEKGKNKKDKEARRKAVLQRWLSGSSEGKQYRDPASTAEGTSKRI